MKHRNVILKFMSIIEMMKNMNKTMRTLKLERRKMQNQIENNKEEEIEKNEEIIMVELQSKEIMRKNLK